MLLLYFWWGYSLFSPVFQKENQQQENNFSAFSEVRETKEMSISQETPIFFAQIKKIHPHDMSNFVQGFTYGEGFFYEGVGKYGVSKIQKIAEKTGEVQQYKEIADQYFGEGIAIVDDVVVQLTWKSEVGFVYDKRSLVLLETFYYSGEGWGITFDGKHLVMSNGTHVLQFFDPETFAVIKSIEVRDRGSFVSYLNELEYVQGKIFANIWKTDMIAVISPKTGKVEKWVDLAKVRSYISETGGGVANGIAWDEENNRLFVTGKNWSNIFEIYILPQI